MDILQTIQLVLQIMPIDKNIKFPKNASRKSPTRSTTAASFLGYLSNITGRRGTTYKYLKSWTNKLCLVYWLLLLAGCTLSGMRVCLATPPQLSGELSMTDIFLCITLLPHWHSVCKAGGGLRSFRWIKKHKSPSTWLRQCNLQHLFGVPRRWEEVALILSISYLNCTLHNSIFQRRSFKEGEFLFCFGKRNQHNVRIIWRNKWRVF